jgi:hypothetical protein
VFQNNQTPTVFIAHCTFLLKKSFVLIKVSASKKRKRNQRLKAEKEERDEAEEQIAVRDTYVKH